MELTAGLSVRLATAATPPSGRPRRRKPRLRRTVGLTLAALLLSGVSHAAFATERYALLIGNAAYASLPALDNPAQDAALLARTLERLDFTVRVARDADYDGMRAAIDGFRREAAGAEVALVYYAGHGVQVDGVNYLLPVDAEVRGRDDLRREGLVLPFLLHEIETASPAFGILVLDACRDNPIAALEEQLAQQAGRSLAPREGLAPTTSSSGLLISYATAPGQVALDGPSGGNSPFAEALAHYLGEPGLEIGLLFRKVSARVRAATAGAQVPWTEASLTGDTLVLNPAPTRPSQTDAIAELNRALDQEDPIQQRLALTRFTRAHGDTPLAQLATAYLARLEPQGPIAGVQLASFETAVADQQRVELVAGSAAAPLANELFAALHAPPAPAADAEAAPAQISAPQVSAAEAAAGAAPPPSDAASLLWPLVTAADRPNYYERFLALFPEGPHAGSAEAAVQLASLEAELPSLPSSRNVAEAPVLVPVVVGTGPVEIPLPQPERAVILREPPRHGRLIAVDPAGTELPLGAVPVQVASLRYLPPQALRRGVDEAVLELVALAASDAPQTDVPAVTRSLEAAGDAPTAGDATAEPEAAGDAYVVQLEITTDPCDQLAGNRFDPQGVVLGNFLGEIDTGAAISACEAAVAAYPDEPRFIYQLGRSVEQAGDYERAAELYEEAAAAGHLLAVYRLGYLFLIGRGVPLDVDKAITFFETAAAGGETYAMNSLARMYAAGDGVEQDRDKAMDLYLRAAAQGNTFAYNNLGYLLAEEGRGDRALPLFQASAEAGDIYGYNNMGYAYQRGIGVEPDIETAIGWYERAAEGGQPNAPINLGFIYRDGAPGLEPDFERAAFWFAEAAKAGNPWGSVHLAALRDAGLIGDGPDPAAAAKLLARVAWIDGEAARDAAEQNYGGAGDAARERFSELPVNAVVMAVQSELQRLGFDPGPADGLPGRRTEAAIDAFLASTEPPLPADLPPIDILAELVRRPAV